MLKIKKENTPMKKLSIILLAFSFLFITGCKDETHLKTSAIIFTRSECTSTPDALKFFNKLKKKNNLITYEIKDLSKAENIELLKKFVKKHNIPTKSFLTPIIFTSKGYSSGWDFQTPYDLKILLNIRD